MIETPYPRTIFNLQILLFSSLFLFRFVTSQKKIRVREIVSINHRGTKRKYLSRDPLFTEKLGGSNVGKGSSGNIFTRVIDRPPVESPGRTCNSVAHACPVSRCFARASTHAMSRCHGLTQLTRVATSPSPSLSSRSSRVDRAHSAQIDAHASILRAPPPSTSFNQFSEPPSIPSIRWENLVGRNWGRGWAANKSKDAVANFRNASVERRSGGKLD